MGGWVESLFRKVWRWQRCRGLVISVEYEMTCSRERDSWRDEDEQEEGKQLNFKQNNMLFCIIIWRPRDWKHRLKKINFNNIKWEEKPYSANTNHNSIANFVAKLHAYNINLVAVVVLYSSIVLESHQQVWLLCNEFKHLQVSQQFLSTDLMCPDTCSERWYNGSC